MHSGVTGNQLPAEHTFRLTRGTAVLMVAILLVLGVVAGLAAGRDFPLAGTGSEMLGRIIIYGCVVIFGLPVVNFLLLPMPHSVRLDAAGVHVQWRDRVADWPWETITVRQNRAGFQEIAPADQKTGLVVEFVTLQDVSLFRSMARHYYAEPIGRREAAQLAAGEVASFSSKQRRAALSIMLFSGLCSLAVAGVLISSWKGLPPEMLWRFDFLGALVFIIVRAVQSVHRYLRQEWFSVRFQPDGLEETWLGGRRLISYGSIDRITHRHGRGQEWLTVRAGRQSLKIGSGLTHFWGALYLLKQRAVAAQWEETGKTVRIL